MGTVVSARGHPSAPFNREYTMDCDSVALSIDIKLGGNSLERVDPGQDPGMATTQAKKDELDTETESLTTKLIVLFPSVLSSRLLNGEACELVWWITGCLHRPRSNFKK